jgi:hypothetical protein
MFLLSNKIHGTIELVVYYDTWFRYLFQNILSLLGSNSIDDSVEHGRYQ